MSTPIKFALVSFVGMLVAQAAWLLAMPPYHAIDEFDHVYRAAGVASGQWRLSDEAYQGRGLEVVVPDDIVAAASRQCGSLSYTGRDNCYPVETLDDGRVVIATAAGRYHPAYYWVIGTAAQSFEGDAANHVMRGVSALGSALAVGFAAYCLALLRAGVWTRLAFMASLTPVLLYTTVIAAPNAWEIVAGLCLWTSLLVLTRATISNGTGRVMVAAATASGVVLVTLRLLGPLWLALIVLAVVLYVGVQPVIRALRRNPFSWLVGSATVIAATAGSLWWILSMEQTELPDRDSGKGLVDVLLKPVTWTLGTVGAFPWRDQPAPMPTYVLYFAVVVTLLVVSFRRGSARERTGIAAAVLLSYAVPASLTLLTLQSHGTIWQGRYGLPFVVGILLLSGLTLDRTGWAPLERVRLVPLGLILLGTAQVWSVWEVARFELERVKTVLSPSWVALPAPVVGSVMAVAVVVVGVGVLKSSGPVLPGSRAGRQAGGDPESPRPAAPEADELRAGR